MPLAGKSPDPNPYMPFIVNFYFLMHALEVSVLYNLRSEIKIYNAQSSMSNLQAFVTLFSLLASDALSQQLLQGSGYGNSHQWVSITSIHQHLVLPQCTFYCSQPFAWR